MARIYYMTDRKKSYLKKIAVFIAALAALLVFFILLLYLLVLAGAAGSLPGKKELAGISNEEATLVYSSDSVLIGKYFATNRTNIGLDELPGHLLRALIETEDRRFYTHKGYDTRSYLRVFIRTILLGDKGGGGGSTITQQLVKNLYGRHEYRFLSITVNKLKELIIASRMEKVYTKDEILILYLNSVPFGQDLYGIESASRRYFNKAAGDLQMEEAAVLVGMLKANTLYNPRLNPENSLSRRNTVLSLLEKSGYIDEQQEDSLSSLPLLLDYNDVVQESPAGYFLYQVRKRASALLDSIAGNGDGEYELESSGLRIYTTLDMKMQEVAESSVREHMAPMQKLLDEELESRGLRAQWYNDQRLQSPDYQGDTMKHTIQVFDWDNGVEMKKMSRIDSIWNYHRMLNASVLIVNPLSGAVITWIGGNHYRLLPFDMVLSHRQIASAFKPILYATALEKGISPCTYLQNQENTYEDYEDWEPRNYDHSSTPDSSVAMWYALAHSINLPTLDLYFRVGRQDLDNTCRKLGFPPLADDAPSIALVTLDLSLYEIVRAYSAFAARGLMNEPYMINMICDAADSVLYEREYVGPDTVFSEFNSQVMTAMLQQVIERGTGASIRERFGIKAELAGKTGTAQNYSNAWFLAYTPSMLIGTWVGARTPGVHFYSAYGSGSSLALPVAAGIIRAVEKDHELGNKYLVPFDLPDDALASVECDPFRQKGIRGFFNRLFGIKGGEKDIEEDTVEIEDEVKSFFKRLFGKKK